MSKMIIALAALFFIRLETAYSYINIYPTKFEKILHRGVGEEFLLYNRTKKILRYRIYLEETGEKNSMTEWTKIYPKSITLNPLEEKKINIYIIPPEGSEAGEYYTELVIKEIESPLEEKTEKVQVMTILKMKLKGIIEEKLEI